MVWETSSDKNGQCRLMWKLNHVTNTWTTLFGQLECLQTKVRKHESTDIWWASPEGQEVQRRSGVTLQSRSTVQWLSRDSLPAKVSNCFFSLNLISHFPFCSLGTKSCFESASPKGSRCFLTVPHFMSQQYFPYRSFLLLWISCSRKSNAVINNLFITSTVLHEHQPPFANMYYFFASWKKHINPVSQGMAS